MKTATLFGATGLIGQDCLKALLDAPQYNQINIIVRRELSLRHPKLKQVINDFSDIETLSPYLAVDDVFCCLGTTLKKAKSKSAFAAVDYELIVNIAKQAKQANTKQFLMISSLGANPKSLNFYSATKGRTEQAIKALKLAKLIILQPSLLIGERQDFRMLEHLSMTLFKWFSFLFVGPLATIKPIASNKVANCLIKVANDVEYSDPVVVIENKNIHQLMKKDN